MFGQAGGTNPSATQSAIEALKSGRDVAEAVGEKSEPEEVSEAPEEETPETEASSDAPEETERVASPVEDIEEIILTDDKGKRKLKLDWNNRDEIKKYVQMAHGARKWQAERDSARGELTKVNSEYKELKETFDTLDKAWKQGGHQALINLLSGNPKGFEEFERQVVAKYKFLENATPEQKKAYEIQQELDRERKEKQRIMDEQKAFLDKMTQEKEAAEAKQVESMVYPSFEKYRFSGKLGDETIEHHLDSAIWTQAIANLEKLDEGEISQERIDREFRTVAATFGKAIGKQASETAKKVIASKKADAKEAVTSAALKGLKKTESSGEVRDKIVKGDLKSAFLDMIGGKKL